MKLPINTKEITLDDKIAELEREIVMREKVYSERAFGPNAKMKPEDAAFKIAVMQKILQDYKNQKAKIGVQATLF